MLTLINELRSRSQQCGNTRMPAAPPLTWDARLETAAQLHSEYMAETNRMTHAGRNGSSFADRMKAQGYQPAAGAENVAAGYPSYASVLTGWMGSPGHCSNLMNPNFSNLGVGVARSVSGVLYWTQNFGHQQ
jgi:uncharacterized protein YkwD